MKANILVTGATGQVGGKVLELLAQDARVAVTAGVRSPEKLKYAGVRAVRLDYDDAKTLLPALEGVDGVFLATGYTVHMLRQSKRFIDHARRAGVKHIVHPRRLRGRRYRGCSLRLAPVHRAVHRMVRDRVHPSSPGDLHAEPPRLRRCPRTA